LGLLLGLRVYLAEGLHKELKERDPLLIVNLQLYNVEELPDLHISTDW